MRYILGILFILTIQTVVNAQTVLSTELKNQKVISELNKKFDSHAGSIKDVPQQFSNESVVILFHSANFFIERGDVINFVEREKKRVYLKDKAAVEKYSTYYTAGYGAGNSSDVTIIKPNGTSRTLQLKDGVEETNYASVPLYYKSSVTLNQKYYKFALPDLEPGDIIDFTQISKHPMGVLTGNIPFSRIYLVSHFPIVRTFVTIEVPTKDSYLYLKSLNGAPELTKKEGTNGVVTYSLEDSLRAKIVNDWNLPEEKYLPHIKFILTRYTGDDNNQVIPIRTSDNRVHTTFSDQDFLKSVALLKHLRSFGEDAADIVMDAVISKNPEAKNDINKLMELSWYYVRNKVINQEQIIYSEIYISGGQFDMYIADIFIEILMKKKQQFDLILTTGNKSAGISNVISPLEINWGLRWNNKYLMYPTYYMQFGELSNGYQGADALVLQNYSFKGKSFVFQNIVMPSTSAKDNALNETYKISINEDFDKIICNRSIEAKKSFTGGFISEYFIRDFNDDQLKYLKMYKAVDSSALYKGLNNTKAAELKRKHSEEQGQYFKAIRDSYTSSVKSEYPMMDEYKSWKINGYAITPNSPAFLIDETFTLNDLVKKAGNGYMVRIGALLGNYDKVEDDFRKRNYNGSMDFASTKTATIIFTIPDGYKVSTQATANKSFSDDFVTFQSTLTVDGNIATLKMTRDIKKTNFTIQEYQTMVKYYDVMYELTQTQIVLKRK